MTATPRHVDDFADDPASDGYAAQWFVAFRRPAMTKIREPNNAKLFATFESQRYRVTGCSQLGDVWLHRDVAEDTTYERRVDVDACSDWAATP